MTNTIQLSTAEYSEGVVRNTLYWISEFSEWTLDKDDSNWTVHLLKENDSSITPTFHRILNDQILREKIDSKTKNFRLSIIRKVLKDMASNA